MQVGVKKATELVITKIVKGEEFTSYQIHQCFRKHKELSALYPEVSRESISRVLCLMKKSGTLKVVRVYGRTNIYSSNK